MMYACKYLCVLLYYQILWCYYSESVNRLGKVWLQTSQNVYIPTGTHQSLLQWEGSALGTAPACSALPAGLTCLKEAAAGMPKASLSSFTSCQAFNASHKFINPGAPFRTTYRKCTNITTRSIGQICVHFLKPVSELRKSVLSEEANRSTQTYIRTWWEKLKHTRTCAHKLPNPANVEINQEQSRAQPAWLSGWVST